MYSTYVHIRKKKPDQQSHNQNSEAHFNLKKGWKLMV